MITVDEALSRGRLLVATPVYILTLGIVVVSLYLSLSGWVSYYWLPVGILLAPVIGWLYWGLAITRWRIWAFRNVRDVNDLRERAIYDKLIWPEGHVLEKTEIRTWRDRQVIKQLEQRPEEPIRAMTVDDATVPQLTRIFRGKKSIITATVFFSVFAVASAVYLFSWSRQAGLGLFCFGLSVYSIVREFRKAMAVDPLLILDEGGLRINDEYYGWSSIRNVEVSYASNMWLTLETSDGKVNTIIDGIEFPIDELRRRLNIYRLRFQQATR